MVEPGSQAQGHAEADESGVVITVCALCRVGVEVCQTAAAQGDQRSGGCHAPDEDVSLHLRGGTCKAPTCRTESCQSSARPAGVRCMRRQGAPVGPGLDAVHVLRHDEAALAGRAAGLWHADTRSSWNDDGQDAFSAARLLQQPEWARLGGPRLAHHHTLVITLQGPVHKAAALSHSQGPWPLRRSGDTLPWRRPAVAAAWRAAAAEMFAGAAAQEGGGARARCWPRPGASLQAAARARPA